MSLSRPKRLTFEAKMTFQCLWYPQLLPKKVAKPSKS